MTNLAADFKDDKSEKQDCHVDTTFLFFVSQYGEPVDSPFASTI